MEASTMPSPFSPTVPKPEPISHVDGVPWHQAPLPRRFHFCRPQSRGSVGSFELVERCPCGGTRLDGEGPWIDKNSRRHDPVGEVENALAVDSLGADVEHIAAIESMLRDLGGNRRG